MASSILTAVQDRPAPPAEWTAIFGHATPLVVTPRNIVDTVADTVEDPRDRKPFAITLDTVYKDSCGNGINISNIIAFKMCRR